MEDTIRRYISGADSATLDELARAVSETRNQKRPRIDLSSIKPGMKQEDYDAALAEIQRVMRGE
jgi:hypothetical protein